LARSPLKQAGIDPLQRLREALVQRYAFERELGRGGMARRTVRAAPPGDPLRKHPRFQALVQ
jgi:hypothetical protein